MGEMLKATSISERRACALVGLSRDSWRHPPQRAQHDLATSQRIVELAYERRRFGYRRIGDLLRAAGNKINDKRVYRLYRLADLSARKRRGKQRLKLERVPLHECRSINEVWSMDFVSDSLASGRRIKCLTVTDDFSHECVDIAVDRGIGGQYVVRVLDQVARFRGLPAGRENRPGARVHEPGLHGLGPGPGRAPHPQPARQAHAERLHRELQRAFARRVPQRPLVHVVAAGAPDPGRLATRLQRAPAP